MPPKSRKKKTQKRLTRKDLRTSRGGGGVQGPASLTRPGNEVIVTFESGAPSRPVILGSLWTSSQAPPVPGKS